jgi:hypothetical protein
MNYILERITELLHGHDGIFAFLAKPEDRGNPDTTFKNMIDPILKFELRRSSSNWFEFQGNFGICLNINAEEDLPETALAQLPLKEKAVAYEWIHSSLELRG